MLPAMKSRRGMTLAEIMVALAMVAIMIVMVVSFVLLLTGRTRANANLQALQQDRLLVESGVEGWLDAVTAAGAALTVPEDGAAVHAQLEEENLVLTYSHGVLTGPLPDGGSIRLHTQTVQAVQFHLEDNGTEYLLICTVISEDPDSGEELTYTFCVNPRVGEIGGTQDEAAETAAA